MAGTGRSSPARRRRRLSHRRWACAALPMGLTSCITSITSVTSLPLAAIPALACFRHWAARCMERSRALGPSGGSGWSCRVSTATSRIASASRPRSSCQRRTCSRAGQICHQPGRAEGSSPSATKSSSKNHRKWLRALARPPPPLLVYLKVPCLAGGPGVRGTGLVHCQLEDRRCARRKHHSQTHRPHTAGSAR